MERGKSVQTVTFDKYVLSSYYASDSVLDFVNIEVNRADRELALLELTFK